jgi:hypothetical protein
MSWKTLLLGFIASAAVAVGAVAGANAAISADPSSDGPKAEIVPCPPLAPSLKPRRDLALSGPAPTCIQVDGLDPTATGPPTAEVQRAICDALPRDNTDAVTSCDARVDGYAQIREEAALNAPAEAAR